MDNFRFDGKLGGFSLKAQAINDDLAAQAVGPLTGGGEGDEINRTDLVAKFLRVNGVRHYRTLYLDVARLTYVDPFGMGAVREMTHLADRVVIIGLSRGLSQSDLNVVTWFARLGECVDHIDDDVPRAA